MTNTLIIDIDNVLCQKLSDFWQPIAVPFSKANVTKLDYQFGFAPLSDQPDCKDFQSAAAADFVMTSSFAHDHDIALPALGDDIAFVNYRTLMPTVTQDLGSRLSEAIQLLRWQADTQFCSRCAGTVTAAPMGERAMVCGVCHLRQYPRIQPCIITAITRPNPKTGVMQILLGHHHRYGQTVLPLQYGLIAGFVEVGESLENAVSREVLEEVGIHVTNIRYISSQPWPYPSNLMLGFRAEYQSGDIVIQEDELSHADFFDLTDLPKIPFKGSIAFDLIAKVALEHQIYLDA